MADLTTSYLGLELRNPVIVGSSGLTKSVSGIKRCEEAGVGAVVLKSVFEEQFLISGDIPEENANIYPEALDYMRQGGLMEYGPYEYTQMIERAKKEVHIPIIASINCQTPKLWPSYAKQIERAGADALELNIYILPIDTASPGSYYEEYHLKILKQVKKEVSIPVSVKLNSQLTSIPYLAQELAEAGCSALVFFNWFLEPDIDVDKMNTRSQKGKGNLYHSLRWVALISGRVECDVAASGGIQQATDVVKQLLAGADAVQVCSLFYAKGIEENRNLLLGLETWMNDHQYAKIEDFRGELSFHKQELTFRDMGEADAYFRAQYLKAYGGGE